MTDQERFALLEDQVRAQWRKYDAALGTKPHIALVQINRKLVRLEHERDALADELRAENHGVC